MSLPDGGPQVGVDFSPPGKTSRSLSLPPPAVLLPYFVAAGAILAAVIQLLLR